MQDNLANEELGEVKVGNLFLRAAESVDGVAADHGKPGGIEQPARQDEMPSMLNLPMFHRRAVLVSQDFAAFAALFRRKICESAWAPLTYRI